VELLMLRAPRGCLKKHISTLQCSKNGDR
jgi:hypothetical protein